jgi:hypothetical protein
MNHLQEVHAIQHNTRVELAYSKAMQKIQEQLSKDELSPAQYQIERGIIEHKRNISSIPAIDSVMPSTKSLSPAEKRAKAKRDDIHASIH